MAWSVAKAVINALRCRCPNCHRGPLFRNWLNRVLPRCPQCGLPYFRESGYYVGGMIITYILTAATLLTTYLVSLFLPDVTFIPENDKFPLWILFGILLALLLVRRGYSLWITLDFSIDPWKPGEERRR